MCFWFIHNCFESVLNVMASINKNCFGLFGCDTTKSQLKEKDDEIEDGEIVDTLNDTKIDQNEQLQFDKLCSRYELEIARKESMKSKKICFICSVNVSKYTCPKCSIKTCSLNCCLRHKKDYDCDGIRDRLSFVPLRNFSDSNLKSGNFLFLFCTFFTKFFFRL